MLLRIEDYSMKNEINNIKRVPNGYWRGEEGKKRGIELTRDLIENKLGWTTDEEIYSISVKNFKDNGLFYVVSSI